MFVMKPFISIGKRKGEHNMKRKLLIKKTTSFLSAALFMMSFSGCDTDTGSSVSEVPAGNTDSSAAENKTYDIVNPGQTVSFQNIDTICCDEESIYVYELPGGVVDKEYAQVADVSTGEAKDIDLSGIDYMYVQSICLDDGVLYVIYKDNNDVLKLCTYDISEKKMIADKQISNDSELSCIRTDGKGGITALRTQFGDGIVSYMMKYDSRTLEQKDEINLSSIFVAEESEVVFDVFSSSDGSAFVFSVEYGMDYTMIPRFYKLDSSGNVIYIYDDFDTEYGSFAGAYEGDNGNIFVCMTKDYSEYVIREINIETGEKENLYEVITPRNSRILGAAKVSGYDLTYISSSGLIGYSFETEESQTLLKFGEDVDIAFREASSISSHESSVALYTVSSVETGRVFTALTNEGRYVSRSELPAKKGYASKFCSLPGGRICYSETYDPGSGKSTISGYNAAYLFHTADTDLGSEKVFSISEIDEYGDASIQNLCSDSEGNLYMCFQIFEEDGVSTVLYVTDDSGKVLHKLAADKKEMFITDLIITDGDDYVLYTDSSNNVKSAAIDYENKLFDTNRELELEENADIVSGNGEYDFYYRTSDSLYGYDLTANAGTKLFDMNNIPFDSGVMDMCVVNDRRYAFSTYDSETGESSVIIINEKQ